MSTDTLPPADFEAALTDDLREASMKPITVAPERKYLASQAWYELGALLQLLASIEPDNIEALRGIALRADALSNVLYAALEDDSFCTVEQMRESLFGLEANAKAARGFALWCEAQESQARARAGVCAET